MPGAARAFRKDDREATQIEGIAFEMDLPHALRAAASAAVRSHEGSKILVVKYSLLLGSGATAARHALDVKIEVRILAPQLKNRLQRRKHFPSPPTHNISKR
jgi:hypothetical protein